MKVEIEVEELVVAVGGGGGGGEDVVATTMSSRTSDARNRIPQWHCCAPRRFCLTYLMIQLSCYL